MGIRVKKFGSVLTSRQAGKEAYSAYAPHLKSIKEQEDLAVDFEGVAVFSPSWADEFLTPLHERFADRLTLKNLQNPSVSLTISTLEKAHGITFKKT